MHARTYKRNRKTIGSITAAIAAGVLVVTHECAFSVRLGGKWCRYSQAEEVVAAIQGAALMNPELYAKLETAGFPPYAARCP